MTSYTDEQVLAIAHELGMNPSRAAVKCKAIASLLEYMVQERTRLQALPAKLPDCFASITDGEEIIEKQNAYVDGWNDCLNRIHAIRAKKTEP